MLHSHQYTKEMLHQQEVEQYIHKRKSANKNTLHHFDRFSHSTLCNPHIANLQEDVLYHLALSTKSHDLKAMFGDVKYVCTGGSPRRMEKLAHFLMKDLQLDLPAGATLENIAKATDRYALYKVGPVLIVSHGMGVPSISIMLNEVLKLLHHACARDVIYFRIGTCGTLGVKPGSVIVSESVVDGLFRPHFELPVLGKLRSWPADLDLDLAHEVRQCSTCEDGDNGFNTVIAKTMCTSDFYEGQGRLDGAFCEYTEKDKMDFLRLAYDQGVRNIEMESLCFAAMCNRAGVRGAVICVGLVDRLEGDQITAPHNTLVEWDKRPALLVSRFVKNQMGQSPL